MVTTKVDDFTSEERKLIVVSLELKYASLVRAAKAESDTVIAERRQAAAAVCLAIAAKFR